MEKRIPFKGDTSPNRHPEKLAAQVHRFRDLVAVYIGTGETVYLEPRQARALATALHRAARSCETESFGDSAGVSVSFDFRPADHAKRNR